MIVKTGKKTVKLRKIPFFPELLTSRSRLTALLKIALFDNIIWYKNVAILISGKIPVLILASFKFRENW